MDDKVVWGIIVPGALVLVAIGIVVWAIRDWRRSTLLRDLRRGRFAVRLERDLQQPAAARVGGEQVNADDSKPPEIPG